MSISFRTLRRLLADQVEPRSWGTVTTTASSGATSFTSTDLALLSGDPSALEAGWAYVTSSSTAALVGQQRPILTFGISVSTGETALANGFTASVPSGTELEVHLRYPVKRGPGTPWVAGYLEILNDAMRRVWFQDDLAVSAVTGQTRYLLDTAAYPFLADDPTRRVFDLMAPLQADNVKGSTDHPWHIDEDAESPALVFDAGPGYATGQTFYLRVARPANTRIKVGGVTWTDISPSALNGGQFGFATDLDEAHVRADDMLAMAITESMNHLAMAQPSMESERWSAKRDYWAGVAAVSKFTRLPRRNSGRRVLRARYVGGGLMSGHR